MLTTLLGLAYAAWGWAFLSDYRGWATRSADRVRSAGGLDMSLHSYRLIGGGGMVGVGALVVLLGLSSALAG